MNEKEIYENWEKTPELFKNDSLKFQNWFDITDSMESVISQGHIDFHTKILTSDVYKALGDVRKKTCLEIGFGGGRILNSASHVFSKSTGIDIHSCFDATEEFLKSQKSKNYKLVHYNDISSIEDESIDFVYSFIVFQHFSSIDYYYNYLNFIKRVMKKDGCCNIHLSYNKWNNEDYYLKSDLQPQHANSTMFYKPEFVKRTIESMGFKILTTGRMTKLPWTNDLSGQFYVIFTH